MPREETVDWVAIGSGCAGLASALFASRAGLRAMVVEKASRLGGATCYSYGSIWAPGNSLARNAGIEDGPDEGRVYLDFLAGGAAEQVRMAAYVEEIGPTLNELAALGMKLQLIAAVPDHYFPGAPGSKRSGRMVEVMPLARVDVPPDIPPLVEGDCIPAGVSWSQAIAWGGLGSRFSWDPAAVAAAAGTHACGTGLVAYLALLCRRAGVAIRPATQVTRLLMEDGRVCGVDVVQDGATGRIRASVGVCLASGGYESNPDLAQRYHALPGCASYFPPTSQGDGLVMGSEIGAAVQVLPVDLTTMVGYWTEDSGVRRFRSAGITELVYPHCVIVNAQGRRFGNESFFQEFMVRLQDFDVHAHRYRNIPFFLVFDEQFARRYSFAGNPPGVPIPPWIPRADTLVDLAAGLGIDGPGLEAAIEHFNTSASEGRDPDFGRGTSGWAHSIGDLHHPVNPNLGPVSQPPFYAVELHPSISSVAGLRTDSWGRVLHMRGHAIPGLWATGTVTAATDYGVGYQAGLSLGSGLVFSRRAARAAVGGRA